MIADLKPYAEYKESGLPWASRIPEHWSLIPNRAVLKKRKILVGAKHGNYRLLSLTKGGVIVRDISTGKGKFSSDMGTSQEVRKGDFVFCLFDVPETPRTVGLSLHDGMITSAYTVFESKRLSSEGVRFLERFYLAMDDQKLLSPLYSGLRHTIPPPRFLGTKTPQPPPDEQAAIVRFLDHANRKIDGFIRAKRKLIGLLNEQKQAIIHRAVTRGINPDVPLKPSGIPWLGDMPDGWETIPIKRVASVLNGFAFSSEIYTSSGIPLIRIGDVKSSGSVDIEHAAKLPGDYLASHSFVGIKRGDLVMAMTGATIGKVARYTHDCPSLLNQRVCAFRSRPGRVTQEYLFLLLSSRLYLQQVLMACYGGAQPNISDSTLAGFKMPIAPIDLQNEIVGYVASETQPLTTAIARTEREIALMQEYRTRLTADLVTGKLDVREAAAKLPATIDEGNAKESSNEISEESEEEILES